MPRSKPALRTGPERDELVLKNQGLVRWVAKKYWRRRFPAWYEFRDLMGAGRIGLIRAAELWDPTKGEFSTIAVQHIRQAIQRARWHYSGPIVLPTRVYEAAEGYHKHAPADFLRDAKQAVRRTREDLHEDVHLRPKALELADRTREENREAVRHWLSLLPEREAKAIRLRYGIDDCQPRTLEQVGAAIGIASAETAVLIEGAIRQMRRLAAG